MKILTDIDSLSQILFKYRGSKINIGFVPTMGAIHEGHLSLIKLAQRECDLVICIIFINPTQFNDSNDLKKYPITTKNDINLLKKQSCDILFMPSINEIYPKGLATNTYQLGGIDKILEGKKRPGHFDGVCTVIHRLFSIIKPKIAYFGEKDFQQVAIIKQMVNNHSLPVQIKTGKTIREKDGLAKSSRNTLLNTTQRKKAAYVYASLQKIKSLFGKLDCAELKKIIKNDIKQIEDMRLDYLDIVNPHSFKPLQDNANEEKAVAVIAVFLNEIRLIDNLSLND